LKVVNFDQTAAGEERIRMLGCRAQEGGHLDPAARECDTTTPTERSAHMATDQITFYDESLKKQIEGHFVSDGKEIHIFSVHGVKSAPYSALGACIDYNAQVSLVRKLLSELARDPDSGKFKDVGQQKDDQQLQPMQSVLGATGGSWGGGVAGGAGANP
jgi:hypothetical protein